VVPQVGSFFKVDKPSTYQRDERSKETIDFCCLEVFVGLRYTQPNLQTEFQIYGIITKIFMVRTFGNKTLWELFISYLGLLRIEIYPLCCYVFLPSS
jgi:hypothetical protein